MDSVDSAESAKDYEILGYKVRLRKLEATGVETPDRIVEHVRERADMLLNKMPHLGRGEAVLLVALSLAQEKLELQAEFRESVDHFHRVAEDALECIESISPAV